MRIDKPKLRQYFLESLAPAEVEEIEVQIISDADFSAELEAVQTELIEEYLEETLTVEERELFETNFLTTPERQNELEFLKSLKTFAQNPPQERLIKETPPSFFELLKNLLSPRGLALGLSVILLAITLGIFWRMLSPGNNLSGEIAALNQRDFSNPDEFKQVTNLNLIAGNLRSGSNGSNLDLNNLTNQVFFRLALPANTPSDSTFQVKLLRDKNMIFTINKAGVYKNEAGQEFRLLIPSMLLKKGDYQIELEKENSKDLKIIYNFGIH